MITCRRTEDTSPAVAYLRRDVLANQCLIESIENNMPPVPREVWVANSEDGTVVGVMIVEDYSGAVQGGGLSPAIRADSSEALSALVRNLNRDQTHLFAVPARFREALLADLSDATGFGENVSMVLAPGNLRLFEGPGEVRQLTLADKELADQFPDPGRGPSEPSLSRILEGADAAAARGIRSQVVFGLLLGGQIVSYVQFGWLLDDLSEVGIIRTRDEHRGKGFAKAVLSHASQHILEQGLVPFYQVRPDNVASVRTAEAVGFREVFRLFFCQGRIKGAGS